MTCTGLFTESKWMTFPERVRFQKSHIYCICSIVCVVVVIRGYHVW